MAEQVDGVEVKLGADTAAAKSGMEDASASIAASLKGIQAAIEKMGASNKSTVDQALKNNADLSRSFLELKASATGGFNAITGVIERFRGVLGSLAILLGGGALFSGAVSSLLRTDDEVEKLENVLGMASDKATTFAAALRIAGSSADAFTALSLKLARQLKANEDAFTANGVATRNLSTGALLPLDAVMQNAFTRMGQLKAGADQAEFALQFFGRSVQEVYQLMVVLPAAQERAKQLMQEMGVEFGPDRQQAVRNYKIDVGAFKETLDIIGEDIGIKVIPRLQAMATELAHLGPMFADLAVNVAVGILGTTDYLTTGLAEWVVKIRSWWNQVIIIYDTGKRALKALLSSGWDAAIAAWDEGEKKRVAISLRANAEILGMEADLAKRIAALSAKPGAAGPGPMPHGGGSFVDVGSDDRLAKFKAELDDMNLANGAFLQLSKQNEAEFWQEKLALVSGNGKKEIALRAEINREILRATNAAAKEELADAVATLHEQEVADKNNKDAQIADAVALTALMKAIWGEQNAAYKKALSEETALREAWAKKEAETAKQIADIHQKMTDETVKYDIAMSKMAEDQKVALGLESNAQRLANERVFVQQEYDYDLAGVNAHIALLESEGKQETEEYAKTLAEKLRLQQAFQKQITQISNAAELERQKYAIEAEKAIESSITDIFANLITNAKNWKQTLLDGFKALDDQLVKISANQLVQQYLGAGTSGGNFLSQLTGAIFGGGGTGAAASGATLTAAGTTLTTAGTTLNTAAVALNSAAAALQASSAAGGGLGGLFSGGGGFDIPFFDVGTPYVPQDTLAFVHRGEAIIPAAYNRGNISGGGGLTVHNHFTVSGPIDTRTQTQIAASASIGVRRGAARNL